ncbi:hypothetical protein HGRIS_005590 [Hohenbuehelia grisea]|uniref:Fungal lipase-type domain-containing protein n=1 Tax=Hohenbuehelia grisea TaxID=104357 RepID=A0ABR3JXL1_9AGAR
MLPSLFLYVLAFAASCALAAPPKSSRRSKEPQYFDQENAITSVTEVPKEYLDWYLSFMLFSSATYCPSSMILPKWDCGIPSRNLPTFVPTKAGGDGSSVQRYIVGHWPDETAVVVAYQGTDPTSLEAILTDLNFPHTTLSPEIFPGIPDDVRVHRGFARAHNNTARIVLGEVQRLRAVTGYTKVYITGHSLGGVLATLTTLMLQRHVPDLQTKTVTFGMPRIGNPAFAKFFDNNVRDFKRVNLYRDMIPVLPPRNIAFGDSYYEFLHTKGEIHILKNGTTLACPGNDHKEPGCHASDVDSFLSGNPADHLGPYPPARLRLGADFCQSIEEAQSSAAHVKGFKYDALAWLFELPRNKYVKGAIDWVKGFFP